ncbi:phosphoribosyltransferase [Lentisalinibacter sediminis]|uniref:phosphoribosyltransferase n=1 Tax=Lentisalinibacter sediminis TaxID=2992237 RepID=UPI003868EB4E
MTVFADRREAGGELGKALRSRAKARSSLVLGLPRGGVPVAAEVATALEGELDVLVVRKIGVPGQPELAAGAIASGGVQVLSDRVMGMTGLGEEDLRLVVEREQAELERREKAYRGDRPPLAVGGREVILVDDGMATGSTMLAAVRAVRKLGAERIIVAVPTASSEAAADMGQEADEVVCLDTPSPYMAVGYWYRDFGQTSDEEVRELLHETKTASTRTDR